MVDLSADEILAIPLHKPHVLFPGNLDDANQLRRRLAARWHPDRNGRTDVAAHVNALFEKAEEYIRNGKWAGAASLELQDNTGHQFVFHYQKSAGFELGRMFIARGFVMYVVDSQYRDLARHAAEQIARLKYKDEAMRKEHQKYMPELVRAFPLASGEVAMVLRKQPDQFPVADIREHLGGSIEPKHVAWILSSLYNVACYLKWAGINHNAISPDTYFVSGASHNGALLGGWWYSAPTGKKPIAVPQRTHRAGSDFTSKAIDGTLIRITGQELLGPLMAKAPKEMQLWLRGLGTQDTYGEYQSWAAMLTSAFGPRRYADLKLPETIY